ncbi:MAG: hypothetical protein CM1200mP26_21050 [Acidimicrobiales bacterium]|nr:MAG: hypothetical protein CM1200mP26_21050 [Acidimicrobiales bacterium]
MLDDPSRRNTMGMAMYAAVPALVAEVNGDPHDEYWGSVAKETPSARGRTSPSSEPNGWVTPTSTTTR